MKREMSIIKLRAALEKLKHREREVNAKIVKLLYIQEDLSRGIDLIKQKGGAELLTPFTT